MPIEDVLLPQMGEGLQESFITALLKTPGDPVEKDEPLFEMETDKANITVESAHSGTLREWLVGEGDIVKVGEVVARIEVETDAGRAIEPPVPELAAVSSPSPNRLDFRKSGIVVPPRTRAHCRSLGISEEEMVSIPAPSGKLMPQDVDHYLALKKGGAGTTYLERHLSARQKTLDYRLRRSAQLVVPASITCPLSWEVLTRAESALQRECPSLPVTPFEVLAYTVVTAAKEYPSFRAVLTERDLIREYAHLNLGIAVHCAGDDLVTAVVHNADTLSLPQFISTVHQRVALALNGQDQSDGSTQMILTYMVDSGITQASPVLVAPAIATLFVGTPVSDGRTSTRQVLNLTLTFDHRLINGIGGARFLRSVIEAVENLGRKDAGMEALAVSPPEPGRQTSLSPTHRSTLEKDRRAKLESDLRSRVSRILEIPETEVSFNKPLRMLGLNSLMSVQLSQQLARDLALEVPGSLVYDYPTLEEIADFLAERLYAPSTDHAEPPASSISGDDPGMKSRLSQLSDEEAACLLEEKLDDIDKRFRDE